MQQGWRAVVANLEDVYGEFMKKSKVFLGKMVASSSTITRDGRKLLRYRFTAAFVKRVIRQLAQMGMISTRNFLCHLQWDGPSSWTKDPKSRVCSMTSRRISLFCPKFRCCPTCSSNLRSTSTSRGQASMHVSNGYIKSFINRSLLYLRQFMSIWKLEQQCFYNK